MDMIYLEMPVDPTDTTLPNPLLPDPILDGDGGGITALFDLSTAISWPSLAAPANDNPIIDLSGGDDLHAKVTGTGPTYAGGGFDFTATSPAAAGRPNTVLAPAGVLAGIAAAADDYFMVCGYFKMPAAWNTQATIQAMFCCTSGQNGYATPAVDLLTINVQNGPSFQARRQTNGGATVDVLSMAPSNSHLGQVTQVAYWRDAANEHLRLKSVAGGVQLATAAVGANNSGDFSAAQPRWGMVPSFTSAGQRTDMRLYRGFIDDLNLDSRDPATVLNEDWDRVVSRFS